MDNSGNPDGIWYSKDGPRSSVVLISRVRMARNIEGFVFPSRIKKTDGEKVQTLVFGAFAGSEVPYKMQAVKLSDLESLSRLILCERGVLDTDCGLESWKGLLFSDDGDLSVCVNMEDHVRVSVFSSGLSLGAAYEKADAVDKFMQKKMEFSAKQRYGFLTSVIGDSGTGMKVSVLVSLPALSVTGISDRIVRDCIASGFSVKGFYSSLGEKKSLGCLYQISRSAAFALNPASQISSLESMTEKVVEMELRARQDILKNRRTFIEDVVFRAITTAKYARFLDMHESVDLLMKIKLALNLGFVTGVEQPAVTALLYRIRPAHIEFLLKDQRLKMEPDVGSGIDSINRARAMIIQEVLKNADIDERG